MPRPNTGIDMHKYGRCAGSYRLVKRQTRCLRHPMLIEACTRRHNMQDAHMNAAASNALGTERSAGRRPIPQEKMFGRAHLKKRKK
mmetsp:Transcript_17902/g.36361  ORF Transcript_17902/g.36361 Transcript_17902/m.36361 type:complete len:86 (-) Transcript_17902:580-837(-)